MSKQQQHNMSKSGKFFVGTKVKDFKTCRLLDIIFQQIVLECVTCAPVKKFCKNQVIGLLCN